MSGSDEIDGTIEKIVYHNVENLFTVAKVRGGDGELTTVVGALAGLPEGTPVRLEGEWIEDKKFGRQFKTRAYSISVPKSLVGIERYLASGLIDGIGPALAKRIVDAFGHDTMEVIRSCPNRLTEVHGIGESRADKIAEAWSEQRDIQEVMIFLRGHNVTPSVAARIFKRYGRDSVQIITENPYRLSLEVWGIGFKTADAIARNIGVDVRAPERIDAGILHVIGELASQGHCHGPRDVVLEESSKILEIETQSVEDALPSLVERRFLQAETLAHWGPCLSLRRMYEAEVQAAELFANICQAPENALKINVDDLLRQYQRDSDLKLADEQRRAIESAVMSKCSVVTGGPGVGKTTIIKALCLVFEKAHLKISLAAPTGRAAKRLSEATGREALTLHRLLEFQPGTRVFEKNREQPLKTNVLIVDEASMIDLHLFHAIVQSVPVGAKLIFVGDIDQLPSVGPGSVLADVMSSGAASVTKLTEIFRQAAQSQIVVSAHRINRGECPELKSPPGRSPERSDFYFVERSDPASAIETIVELCTKRIPKRFGFDPTLDIQVLTPMHRGPLGTIALNQALQESLVDQSGAAITRGQMHFRVGDKVMQTKNNYEHDVFNGDVGIVRRVDTDDQFIEVELLDERTLRYEREQLDQLIHGFACSIHKSQGSEYPAVVIPVTTQHYVTLQRNLLYTAVTRGKKLVVLVGMQRAIDLAVKNEESRQRTTYLSQRIQDHVESGVSC